MSQIPSTMANVPLSLNHFLERAGKLFSSNEIVSRLPDKTYARHTYGEFYERTRKLARALKDLGLKKGERVATLCWNHHAHLESYFGIPAAGGVAHTLNIRLPPEEIAWIARDACDRFLIVDDILLPLYRKFEHLYQFEKVIVFPFSGAQVDPSFLDYEKFLAASDDSAFEYAEHDENDPVSMCYTSGTTGKSKGVVYSHRSTVLHTLVLCLGDVAGLQNSDVILPVTPMFHVNSWGIPYAAVMLGVKLVFPGPHLQPDDLLDLMQVEPPTLALGVPTIWMGLIQAFEVSQTKNPGRWKLPSGMRSIVGGSAVTETLIRAFHKHNIWLKQGWGMTETSPLGTVSYLNAALLDNSIEEKYRRAAMAGIPVPLVDLRIRSDAGNEAPWDGRSVGEVELRGPFVTASYHQVEASEEKFTKDGWIKTGDVGVMDEFGYLKITDRSKDLIKSGGEWISSVDLENALMAHPNILEAAVIAIPDAKWSERPLACVVAKSDNKPSLDELNSFLLTKGFAKWQLPDRYEVIDALPRTSTGKFYKLKLREMFPS